MDKRKHLLSLSWEKQEGNPPGESKQHTKNNRKGNFIFSKKKVPIYFFPVKSTVGENSLAI